jgi:undecaprenyl phosphate-alpha-L-ara4N flippase subunit ArnF
MTQIVLGFAFAFLTAIVVTFGDVALKLAADGEKPIWSGLVLVGCVIYAVSAIFWFHAMKQVGLAQAAVAYSMLTLLVLCAIGAIWFDERLYAREYLGIACAVAAMALMARVA